MKNIHGTAIAALVLVLGGGAYYAFEDSTLWPWRGEVVALKDAKLNIEHNASDNDTGFQGFIDGEGWSELTIRGPEGVVLEINGEGALEKLGLTELFFETVEPANVDVSVAEMLKKLPEGHYTIEGPTVDEGKKGYTKGTAWLTHVIPAGPVLITPSEGAVVSTEGELVVEWGQVTKTITGAPVKIIAYELIVQKDEKQHPHMIGKRGLDMHLPASVTRTTLPRGFLEAETTYKWEVLAVEESGNQTLSSGTFSTKK